MAEVDAAYARLARDLGAAAPAGEAAAMRAGYVASDAEDPDELFDALDDGAAPRQPGAKGQKRAVVPNRLAGTPRSASTAGAGILQNASARRLALGVGGLAIALVAVVAVYKLGEPAVPGLTGSPAPGATAGLDTARVATLMGNLATNPRDLPTLRELANLYYDAGDFAQSRSWLEKILAIDPRDIEALLGAGANAYNLGDLVDAEAKWRAVLAVDPKNVDAHYDLGLMYFSKDPPDLTRMREEWNQVVALAPDSQLASIVKTHMTDPSAAPGSSGAPSAPPSTPPSPAPSAVASPS
jgi:tetratricopeptide (TPR) repeat protein